MELNTAAECASPQTAIIMGAGPAGLTAAYELATRTCIKPLVLEMSSHMGGLSRTVNYKGNRIDIGGHRFFSKSDRVMDWWLRFLPLQKLSNGRLKISYQNKSRDLAPESVGPDPDRTDLVMLVRARVSHIYFTRQFFKYPISLNADTIRRLGLVKVSRISLSYLRSKLFPIRPEKSLADFLTNRFGRRLYEMFFKSYTEKVWGVPCEQISPEWGAQRIKGLTVRKAVLHFLTGQHKSKQAGNLKQKATETSLIERFLYPKLGPGQMWDEVARQVQARGGCIQTGWRVTRLHHAKERVQAVTAVHQASGEQRNFTADYFFSTIPVQELVANLEPPPPPEIRRIADGLVYRDFITVGLLCTKLSLKDKLFIDDNWIYIQEPDVLAGRLQIFNNWSPYLVADPAKIWLGLEYFCFERDELWRKSDEQLIELAKEEMQRMELLRAEDVLDATVIRMPKTYPAYFGTYPEFPEIIDYMERFQNLFLIGRNGMHKYNNQDHSMLAAMTAVDNIIGGVRSRDNLWSLNTEQEYQEQK